ncbi:simple sugar transport system substrate-binding protein/ribose transport system substrate-binding protein [Anaerobium acetethylicum]|uniref:Simple sugar transport system substrate-binding protein/ribose transport system substrate-binding protein n=1 Tax=Anaerobium acetethylicum TaxID=1619234 RepID=A0A1D3TYU2_9FIRM|nr:simple sugar transport system substrate-binding protein/ribose transport system substrate-binding protein [Anaerobium acetethylicum]
MKNSRVLFFSLLIVAVIIGLITSMSSIQVIDQENVAESINKTDGKQDNQELIIGVSLASPESEYMVRLEKYIREAADERDVSIELHYADWNAKIQQEQMKQFIEAGVDAIILCPINSKSMLGSVKAAKEAGIPVINLNMKVDSVSTEYIDTYVGASMSEQGALAAEILIDTLGAEGGRVGIIEGAPGSDPAVYRTEAFYEKIKLCPQIEVVGIINGGWDREKAYLAAYDLIRMNEDLDVIYCHDSNMAMGAYRAVEQLGKEEQIRLIGIGEDEEYIQAVKNHEIYGIVTQSAEYEGKYSIYCAVDAVNGEPVRPWYKTPIQILTIHNIDEFEKGKY